MSRSIVPDLAELRGLVPHRQPDAVRRGDAAPGRRAVAARSRATLDAAGDIPVTVVWKPVLTDTRRRSAARSSRRTPTTTSIGVIAWMHTFSPAKMWIAGLDALRKPLLHLHTQANVELPWADDRLRLHEPQPGRARRPRVRLHPDPPRRRRARPSSATSRNPAVTAQVGTWARAAAGWAAARDLKLARFGDNMRYVAVTEGDKTEAELRFGVQVNTWGVNELADAVRRRRRRRRRRPGRRVPRPLRRRRRAACRAATATSRCATAPRIELGLRSFLEAGGFGAFTTSFEDLGALRQLPGLAVQRLMADGYGFGAEGDWKTAILVRVAERHGRRPARRRLPHGGLHLRPRCPGDELILGAHMLEVCPSLTTAQAAPRDPPARHRRQGGPGAAGLHRRPRPRRRRRAERHARPVPARRQRGRDRRRCPQPLPKLPVGRAVWKPAPDFATSAAAWLTAGAAHHTVMTTAVGVEVFERLRRDRRAPSCSSSTTTPPLGGFERELRWNAAYYRLAQGHMSRRAPIATRRSARTGRPGSHGRSRTHSTNDHPSTKGTHSEEESLFSRLVAAGAMIAGPRRLRRRRRAATPDGDDGGDRRPHRRRDADQVVRALDRRRQRRQGRPRGARATRSTCSTPRTTSPRRSADREHDHQGRQGPDHRRRSTAPR